MRTSKLVFALSLILSSLALSLSIISLATLVFGPGEYTSDSSEQHYIYPENRLPASSNNGWFIPPRAESTLAVVAQTRDKQVVSVLLTVKTIYAGNEIIEEFQNLLANVDYRELRGICQTTVEQTDAADLVAQPAHDKLAKDCVDKAKADVARIASEAKVVVSAVDVQVVIIPSTPKTD